MPYFLPAEKVAIPLHLEINISYFFLHQVSENVKKHPTYTKERTDAVHSPERLHGAAATIKFGCGTCSCTRQYGEGG